MLITIDTDKPVSRMDRAILESVLSDGYEIIDADGYPAVEYTDPETPPLRVVKEDSVQQDESLIDRAVERATALMKAGQTDRVKAALDSLNVRRVTMLDTDEKVAAFLDKISD